MKQISQQYFGLKLLTLAIIFVLNQSYVKEALATEASSHAGHDHSKMQHNGMMPTQHHDIHPQTKIQHPPATQHQHQVENTKPASTNPTGDRDPNAYTNGYNFNQLPKHKMAHDDYFGSVIVDRLEAVNTRDGFGLTYDWQAWYGQDYDKAVVRAEGEIDQGTFKNARNELFWGHAISAFWDSHLGIRYDSGLGAERTWGAFGFQGYAPYWVYIEATGYVGEEGRTAFRLETEYDVLFTQKLILQPRIEMNFYSQRDLSRLVSSGLSNMEAGLRLRYEFKREFAPYIGVEWAGTFGAAADVIRAKGKNPEETRFVAGVHFWF